MTDQSYDRLVTMDMPTDTFFNLPASKQQLILDLAIDEFATSDYRHASITRLVARAGIAKGSFYQYFADKQDLYVYLLKKLGDEKTTFFSSSPPPEPNAGFFATLRWMFYVGLEFEFSNPKLAQIGYRAVYGDAPLPELTAASARQASIAMFQPMIERAMATGELDENLDSELAAVMVYGLMSQLGDYLLARLDMSAEDLLMKGARQLDRDEYWTVINGLIGILEHGLRPNPDRMPGATDGDSEKVEQ